MFSNNLGETNISSVEIQTDGSAAVRLHATKVRNTTHFKKFFEDALVNVSQVTDVIPLDGKLVLVMEAVAPAEALTEAEAKELARRYMAAVDTAFEELTYDDHCRVFYHEDFNPMAVSSIDTSGLVPTRFGYADG